MLTRVLIVDDEPLARQRISALVRAHAPTAHIDEAGDGPTAIDVIRDAPPDAVFLDIQMPGQDGFGVIDAVGPQRMPPTVFVTAYDAHALKAFDVSAVDYLLKPFDDERFEAAWQRLAQRQAGATLADDAQRLQAVLRAVASHGVGQPRYLERFLVKQGEKTVLVPIAEVAWMKSDGNYIDLVTPQGTFTVRETMAGVERQLDPARFVRIHRRVIVAIDRIRELQPWFGGDQLCILRDGTKLRVSRTRREFVTERLAGRPG